MLMWYEGFYCILYTTFKSITGSTLYPKQQNVTVKFANVNRLKKRTPIIIRLFIINVKNRFMMFIN